MKPPRVIVITGAGRGLGAALARVYAAPGICLSLSARTQTHLQHVVKDCEQQGARVLARACDICDRESFGEWVAQTQRTFGAIDLFIANAGIFSGHGADRQRESRRQIMAQFQTNLAGTVMSVETVADHMQKCRHGQIAIVSSLAALLPMADAPAYSAAKAGLLAYGEALREYLAEYGVGVAILLPGHIETRQTAVHRGPLVGMISPEQAAQTIRRQLARGRTFIAFPAIPYLLVRLSRLLPWRMRAYVNRPFRFYVAQDEE